MIGLTLRQLRYFEALARHLHFGRAAEFCSISQPALSLQIKELEAMFHTPLVERGARQLRLTAIGERLAEKARKILLSVEELDDLVRASQDLLAGRLRMGIIPTVAPYLLPTIISKLTTWRSRSVATTAISIPVAPIMLPRTAVRGCASPRSPRMNRTAATMYERLIRTVSFTGMPFQTPPQARGIPMSAQLFLRNISSMR